MSDILNELELGCALYLDRQYSGHTGQMAVACLKDILKAVEDNRELADEMRNGVQHDETFACIKKFARKNMPRWAVLH